MCSPNKATNRIKFHIKNNVESSNHICKIVRRARKALMMDFVPKNMIFDYITRRNGKPYHILLARELLSRGWQRCSIVIDGTYWKQVKNKNFSENHVAFIRDPLVKHMFIIVWALSSHSRIFHAYGDVTITGEGLLILTYARHSWPLSRDGSLARHTHWDTGHSFIKVISEDPWHSYLFPIAFSSWAVTTRFYHLGLSSGLGFENLTFRLRG